MLTQQAVEEHRRSIDLSTSHLLDYIEREVEGIVTKTISSALLAIPRTKDGGVKSSGRTVAKLVDVEKEFRSTLRKSGYEPCLTAFVSNYHEQISEFNLLYKMMTGTNPKYGEFGGQYLEKYLELSLQSLYHHSEIVASNLRAVLVGSLGSPSVEDLVNRISDCIRKLTRVVPKAKDQLVTFFRIAGNHAYMSLEEVSGKQVYMYVGSRPTENTRDFCDKLMRAKRAYTKSEIMQMDSQQIDPFSTCGGHGCMHWWALS